jgi:hypothetical protein
MPTPAENYAAVVAAQNLQDAIGAILSLNNSDITAMVEYYQEQLRTNAVDHHTNDTIAHAFSTNTSDHFMYTLLSGCIQNNFVDECVLVLDRINVAGIVFQNEGEFLYWAMGIHADVIANSMIMWGFARGVDMLVVFQQMMDFATMEDNDHMMQRIQTLQRACARMDHAG